MRASARRSRTRGVAGGLVTRRAAINANGIRSGANSRAGSRGPLPLALAAALLREELQGGEAEPRAAMVQNARDHTAAESSGPRSNAPAESWEICALPRSQSVSYTHL